MGRQVRIEYENALYHIMSHGNGKQWLYKNNKHIKLFIELLKQIVLKFHVVIHAFVLMRNHYHILLETPKANLSDTMKYFNQEFARRYNFIENRKGGIFRDRYKAILIEKNEYFLNVLRYIAQNPKRIGLVENCEDYLGSYLNDTYSQELNTILSFETIKTYFKPNNNWKQDYYNWLNEKIEINPMKGKKYKYLLGTEKWVKKFKTKSKLNRNILERKKYYKLQMNEKILFDKYSKGEIEQDLVLYFYNKYSGLKMIELKEKLNLQSISSGYQKIYRIKQKIFKDKYYKKQIMKLENAITEF